MQKQVSKQSLAIVALSILLAICMALTATYAAFAATPRTVTGNITFVSPTLTITTAGSSTAEGVTISGEGADVTLTITQAAFDVSNESAVTLTTAAKEAIASIQFSVAASTNSVSEDNKIHVAVAYGTNDNETIQTLLPLFNVADGAAGSETVALQKVFGTVSSVAATALNTAASSTVQITVTITAEIVAAA